MPTVPNDRRHLEMSTNGKAVEVVKLRENSNGSNSYELDEKALEKILLAPNIKDLKIVLISVAGPFRKGKSFLLNFFVLYLQHLTKGGKKNTEWFDKDTVLDSFHWRGGAKRDTCGIILWNEPFILEDANSNKVAVFLMDTQGSYDTNSTMQDNCTIFSLSTILSSVQIFNLSQNIQEDNLQQLQLFAEYGKLAKQDNESTNELQKLMFLIRDWSNDYEKPYGFEGGQQLLDEVLEVKSRQPAELRELRESLRCHFSSMSCFLLPHPGLRVAKNLGTKTVGDIEVDFKREVECLTEDLFARKGLIAKKIMGRTVSCAQFADYFKSYMKVFSSGKLPRPQSILKATAEVSYKNFFDASKEIYENGIENAMWNNALDSSQLLPVHRKLEKEALNHFKTCPAICVELRTGFFRKLEDYIHAKYNGVKREVDERERLEREKWHLAEQKKKAAEDQRRETARIEAERKWMNEQRQREVEEVRQRKLEVEREHRRKQEELEAQYQRQRERDAQKERERAREREAADRINREQVESLRQQMRSMQLASSVYYGGFGGGGYGGGYGGGNSAAPSGYTIDRNGRYHDATSGRFIRRPE